MAKKTKTVTAAKVGTRGRKSSKAVVTKTVRAKTSAAKKPSPATTRRGRAEVTKLQKAVVKALKSRSAVVVAGEFGISKAYVYALKYRRS